MLSLLVWPGDHIKRHLLHFQLQIRLILLNLLFQISSESSKKSGEKAEKLQQDLEKIKAENRLLKEKLKSMSLKWFFSSINDTTSQTTKVCVDSIMDELWCALLICDSYCKSLFYYPLIL